jgi:hypothetical protein
MVYGVIFILWLIAGAMLFVYKKPVQKHDTFRQM